MYARFLATAWIALAATSLTAFSAPAHATETRADATRPASPIAPLRSGVYILERFETLDAGTVVESREHLPPKDAESQDDADPLAEAAVGALGALASHVARDLEAEVEAAARASWMEVDAQARTAQLPALDGGPAKLATFKDDFSRLVPEDTAQEPMSIEVLDAARFAMDIRLFTTHRLTWRRVEPDAPELRERQRERDAALADRQERDGVMRAELEAAAQAPARLDVRVPLPDRAASLALPADVGVHGFDGEYRFTGMGDTVVIRAVDDPALADETEAEARARLERNTRAVVTLDGVELGRGHFGRDYIFARTDREGEAWLLWAEVDAADVSTVLAIWRSLDGPVAHMTPLRAPDTTLPDDLKPVAEVEAALDEAFSTLLEPARLMHANTASFDGRTHWNAPLVDLREEGEAPMRVAVILLEARPEAVLSAMDATSDHAGTALQLDDRSCRAVAALPVDLGARRRTFSLALRQADGSDYAHCTMTAAALARLDLQRTRRARVPAAVIERLAAFERIETRDNGSLLVRNGRGAGVLSAEGEILVPPVYDRISTHSRVPGYLARLDGRVGLFDTEGRAVLPVEFDTIDRVGEVLIARRNDRRAAFTIEGRALTGFDYEQLHSVADGALLRMRRGDRYALFDPDREDFLVPPDAGVTRIRVIRDRPRFITESEAGETLYDFDGRAIIEHAQDLYLVGNQMVAVRETADGLYHFHDLDGRQLSETGYASVRFSPSRQHIRARDTDGRTLLLDTALEPRSPEGLDAVFAASEDGYVVVADDGSPRRMGLSGPDLDLVLPLEFEAVFIPREGLVVAQTPEGLWGAWNMTGEPVLAPEWDRLSQSFGGVLYAERDGLWRAIDHAGEARDARRWSALQLHTRNMGGTPPFATARIHGTPDDGRWEVLDMQAQRVLEGTFDDKTDLDGGVRLRRGDEDIQHPAT